MSHFLPTTIPRENNLLSRILVAVDGSEHSARALRYVGTLLRDTRDVQITLFHVLKPMPRELLEHGGSEVPARIRITGSHRKRVGIPYLGDALELFGKTGFPLDRVALKFGHEDDIAILFSMKPAPEVMGPS